MLELVLMAAMGTPYSLSDYTEKMCALMPPGAVLEADDPAYVWFMETSDGQVMYLSHTTAVCCFEGYVWPDADDWDFTGWAPMDFFEEAGMAFEWGKRRAVCSCQPGLRAEMQQLRKECTGK